jgi:hypothetical protein
VFAERGTSRKPWGPKSQKNISRGRQLRRCNSGACQPADSVPPTLVKCPTNKTYLSKTPVALAYTAPTALDDLDPAPRSPGRKAQVCVRFWAAFCAHSKEQTQITIRTLSLYVGGCGLSTCPFCAVATTAPGAVLVVDAPGDDRVHGHRQRGQ